MLRRFEAYVFNTAQKNEYLEYHKKVDAHITKYR